MVTYIVTYLWEYFTTSKCSSQVAKGGKPTNTRSQTAAEAKNQRLINRFKMESLAYERHNDDRFFNEFWGLFFFAFLVIIVLLIVIGPFMLLGWADSNTFFSVLQRIIETMAV
jgi:hypothetical protein